MPPESIRKPLSLPRDAGELRDGVCFFCEPAWIGLSKNLCLTKREAEIVQCHMLGDDERAAAAFLRMSHRTLRSHRERLYQKLGVHSRAELILLLTYVHLEWLCEAGPLLGCRLQGRLVRIQ